MRTTCGYPGCGVDTGARPYARSGIPSVTTVIDLANFDSKGRRMAWSAAEKAAVAAVHFTQDWWDKASSVTITQAVLDIIHDEGLEYHLKDVVPCTQDHKVWPGLCPACKFLRSRFHYETERKKHLGSHLHHLALSWAQGEEIPSDERLDPYLDGLEAWYELYKPAWAGLEQIVYMHNNAREYVGTFDALADLDCPIHLGIRDRWLLDIKTGQGRWDKEWALQLAAYRYANEITEWRDGKQYAKSSMPLVTHTGVIWLHDTGEAELVEVETSAEEWNQFQRLLDVWQWSKRFAAAEEEEETGATV